MSELSNEDIFLVVKSKCGDEDFGLLSCEEIDASDKPVTGLLSSSSRWSIKYEKDENLEELNIFVKALPESVYHQETILSLGAFEKEVLVYNLFLNNFQKYFEDVVFPKCYLGRSKGLLVLDDLSSSGSNNFDNRRTYDLSHCERVVETISKLHAGSILYEFETGKKITDLLPSLKIPGVLSTETETERKFNVASENVLRRVAKEYLKNYSEYEIERALKVYSSLPERLGPSDKFVNVLSHADMWTNNIMFNYDKEENVTKACLIDFQFSTYTTPAFDLLMALHNCTTSELRNRHYNYLITYYYESLRNLLKKHNFDLDTLIPWSDFEDMLDETKALILPIAPVCIHFALMPEVLMKPILEDEKKHKMYLENDRDFLVLEAMERYDFYKRRVLDSLTDLIDYFKDQ